MIRNKSASELSEKCTRDLEKIDVLLIGTSSCESGSIKEANGLNELNTRDCWCQTLFNMVMFYRLSLRASSLKPQALTNGIIIRFRNVWFRNVSNNNKIKTTVTPPYQFADWRRWWWWWWVHVSERASERASEQTYQNGNDELHLFVEVVVFNLPSNQFASSNINDVNANVHDEFSFCTAKKEPVPTFIITGNGFSWMLPYV